MLSRDGQLLPFGEDGANSSIAAGGSSSVTLSTTASGYPSSTKSTGSGGGDGVGGDGAGGDGAGGDGAGGDGAGGGQGGSSPLTVEWNAWDINTEKSALPASGKTGHDATVYFYRSISASDLNSAGPFSNFHNKAHPESFNHVEAYWGMSNNDNTYPYAGKSTVGRGMDDGETNAPPPSQVKDMQLHPPNDDSLAVVAFEIPAAGNYTISNLGVRRVHDNGDNARLVVQYPCDAAPLATLQAKADRAWTVSNNTYALGQLTAGERICFGVDRDGNYAFDAVELTWILSAQLP